MSSELAVALTVGALMGAILILLAVSLTRMSSRSAVALTLNQGAAQARAEIWDRWEADQKIRDIAQADNVLLRTERDQAVARSKVVLSEQDRLRDELVRTSLELADARRENIMLKAQGSTIAGGEIT